VPALPSAAAFTGAGITEAQFKTALTDLHDFLSGLLGTEGTQAAALAALGAALNGVVGKSAAYTVIASDRGNLIDATSGTWSLGFTASATLGDGFVVGVRNSGAGVITLDPNASELIDGASTITLAAGESCLVVCNGTAWKTVGKTVPISYPISVANGGTGSGATPTVSSSPQADAIKAVKHDHGHANVGSLVFAERQTTGAAGAITAGSTYAGSDLLPIGEQSDGSAGGTVLSSTIRGAALSGTWRALGTATPYAGNKAVTLFQRIA
jgi:hypothetical protein